LTSEKGNLNFNFQELPVKTGRTGEATEGICFQELSVETYGKTRILDGEGLPDGCFKSADMI
jgi:hypothetical protein